MQSAKHKKNGAKAANNAGISSNSASPLRKKQRNNNCDNNNDNYLVSYYQKTCFCCQQLSVLIIFQQLLTQETANIIVELENNEDDQQLIQEAIDIINELENNNMNNDDDNNNALLELPANAQQLTRDSLQCLQDAEGWIVDEVILAYYQEIVLAHRRDETLLVTPDNFVYADNPTSWPPEEGEISLLTQPIFLANWQYALIPIWNNHHWFLAVAFRQNNIVRVFDTKRGNYLNNVFDRLNRIATLLFGMTQFTIVAANPSTFFNQRDGWSCGIHVCIIANRIMSANHPFNCGNLLYDMHAVRQ
jgi:Ulp1 family protease